MIVLNLGSGGAPAPEGVVPPGFQEIHVDLVSPADVRADVRALPFADESVEAIFCSHLLEHLPEWDVVPALAEWRRVLKPGGALMMKLPDVQSVAEAIVRNGVDAITHVTNHGTEIRAQDILYGWQASIAKGREEMRHLCAFDQMKLARCFEEAGYSGGAIIRCREDFELQARANK